MCSNLFSIGYTIVFFFSYYLSGNSFHIKKLLSYTYKKRLISHYGPELVPGEACDPTEVGAVGEGVVVLVDPHHVMPWTLAPRTRVYVPVARVIGKLFEKRIVKYHV